MEKSSTTTIGIDVGDQFSVICVLDGQGEVCEESRIRTRPSDFKRRFSGLAPTRIAIEAGPECSWMSRLLSSLEHEVIVANPWRLRVIYENKNKSDQVDAEMLARVARMDPALLYPVKMKKEENENSRTLLHSRDLLVRLRTKIVNHVRGLVKQVGQRMPSCAAERFHKHSAAVPESRRDALLPLMECLEEIQGRIKEFDKKIQELLENEYSEAQLLTQVPGVGPLTAMSFVLNVEDPNRFKKSRSIAGYLGLKPRRDQSGASDPKLPITKTGNKYLRRLLVSAAHYILGPFGPESHLRKWGLKLHERGGRASKKKAVVAVARKLAVLLVTLWKRGDVYDPLRQMQGKDDLKLLFSQEG